MGIVKIAAKSGLVALGWLFAAGALAQDNPEGGDEGAAAASASGTFGTTAAADTSGVTADTTATTDTSATPVEESVPDDDHGAVVGRLGIGFFGIQTLPVGNPGMPGAALDLSAPTVGVRYWLSAELGIEAAVGFALTSSGTDGPGPGETTSSGFGFALHGGVPLALASSGHFVFEVVPQLNFGIASRSDETMAGMPAMTFTNEASGMLIELGAMAGAEVHFGFVDLPNLSLQGGVGFMIRVENRSVTPMGIAATDTSNLVIGTARGQEPWDFFRAQIAAIYYL